jgi:hypothetical protein
MLILYIALRRGVYVTSHIGNCPILELDGHPKLEILVWDGQKLWNIMQPRRILFAVEGSTMLVLH